MSIRALLAFTLICCTPLFPASAQEAKSTPPAAAKKRRTVTHLDQKTVALANDIDDLRAQMAAENERHFKTISELRDQLKQATDSMITHRQGHPKSQ